MITVIDENNLPVKYVKCEAGAEDMQCGINQTWVKGTIFVENTSQVNIYEIRQELVDNIEVIYNGVVYQGDETSQSRMSRAITGLPDDTTIIKWRAKDNTSHELNKSDLKQILYLAGQEQTRIWFS